MSKDPSGRVVPVARAERSSSSSRWSRSAFDISLRSAARWPKVRARSAGPPRSRAQSSAAAKSTPREEARAITSSVEGLWSGAKSASASCQRPAT